MKKMIAALTGILLLCTAGFSFGTTNGQAVFSNSNVELSPGVKHFSVDVLVKEGSAYNSAEFGIKINGDFKLTDKGIVYSKAIPTTVTEELYKGVQYFGFFGTEKKYAGTQLICTLQFETTGAGGGTIEMTTAQVVRLNSDNTTASKQSLSLPQKITVTRKQTGGNSSNNGNGTNNGGNENNSGNNNGNNGNSNKDKKSDNIVIIDDQAVALSAPELIKAKVSKESVLKEEIKSVEKGAKITFESIGATLKLNERSAVAKMEVAMRVLKNSAYGELSPIKIPQLTLKPAGELFAFDVGAVSPGMPFRLTLPYDSSKVKSSDRLGVFGFDRETETWKSFGGVVDPVSKTVTFTAYASGDFVICEGNRSFSDLKTVPQAKEAIEVLASKGILSGTANGSFKPNDKISRAEVSAILVKAFDLQADKEVVFKDLGDKWYAQAMSVAGGSGVLSGSNGKADPNGFVTREQLAVMVAKAYEYQTKKALVGNSKLNFKDAPQISSWAKSSVTALIDAKLMGGKTTSTFVPKAPATRAEAAQVIYNALAALGKAK